MSYAEKALAVYRRKFPSREREFNRPRQLPAYFAPLIGDKKSVRIAELGAGPVNTIGNEWPGVEVDVWASDVMWPEYQKFWEHHGKTPLVPILEEDMENLSYLDDFFDVVHCRNALDHTRGIHAAVAEMQRVCKPGGLVYLAHAPGQKRAYGGHHYHNFEEVELPGFAMGQDGEMIVSVWQKP